MVTLTVRSVESEAGFVMSALLVSIFIMSLLLAMALPVWHHAARRERESELIFRGEQYARAIALWQRQRPGSTPQDIDTLIEERFLRKRYRDPMTKDGKFQILLQSDLATISDGQMADSENGSERFSGQASQNSRDSVEPGGVAGGIVGVVSASDGVSIASYNGRNRYNEWVFIHTPNTELAPSAEQSTIGPDGIPQGNPRTGPTSR
ncbi:MAG TPA: type II secretion system protein [Acidobacteria bacterium]|jgi:type II secretory pathway pseudopilin PulG|nr:type II secretion system protein [Acidobacteriota bacterium]